MEVWSSAVIKPSGGHGVYIDFFYSFSLFCVTVHAAFKFNFFAVQLLKLCSVIAAGG